MGLCFGSGFCKKVDTREDSCRVDSKQGSQRNQNHKIDRNYKMVASLLLLSLALVVAIDDVVVPLVVAIGDDSWWL